ncbi:hypothetical protein [Rossellomorea sp. NRS-1567]|uniref:hypothetical protein n=1 Tax=Rossellomorea sp. NRS-1567 TaxID=3233901 RepID=UPI003D2B3979
MKAIEYIKKFRVKHQENFNETAEMIHGKVKGIVIFSHMIDERSIRGGLDEWERREGFAITSDGWLGYTAELETNTYKYAGYETTEFSSRKLSDESMEQYFNSEKCSINKIFSFIEQYNELASNHEDMESIEPKKITL